MIGNITGAIGYRPNGSQQSNVLGASQAPGGPNAAQSLQSKFGGVFQSTFSSSMATVFERGAAGEFDDPTLALQEQAALQRLRAAQQQPQPTTPQTGGANAAPDAQPATPTPAAGADVVDEQREIYALHVRQSEARLANISSSLAKDFPLAAKLSSASTGTWDPTTFVPRTREEVEAFAQRMVIDATEAAARLEIVKTQLDAARFEAQNGSPTAQQLVARLQADYDRQKSYVDKLATIVDKQSGGQVSDAGQEALNGRTMRTADDISVAELAHELRASGMDEEQVQRVIGAGELGVEQEKTPGGSPRLKKISADMTATLLANFNRVRREHEEEFQRQEQDRADRRRVDDKHADQRRTEQNRLERAQAERSATERQDQKSQTAQSQQQRAEQRRAEFQQWMQTLAQAAAEQRSDRAAG